MPTTPESPGSPAARRCPRTCPGQTLRVFALIQARRLHSSKRDTLRIPGNRTNLRFAIPASIDIDDLVPAVAISPAHLQNTLEAPPSTRIARGKKSDIRLTSSRASVSHAEHIASECPASPPDGQSQARITTTSLNHANQTVTNPHPIHIFHAFRVVAGSRQTFLLRTFCKTNPPNLASGPSSSPSHFHRRGRR